MSRKTIVTILMTAVVLWTAAFALWMQADLDKWLLTSHNGLRAQELVVDVARMVSRYGMPAIVLTYLIYLLCTFRDEKLRDAYRIYLLVIFMFGIAGVVGDL